MTPDPDSSSDDGLPPRLLADLRGLHRTPAVPPAIDAAVRSAGRAYFARQRRVRLWVRAGGAAAAAVVLGVGVRLALPPADGREPTASGRPAPAGPAATRLAAAGPAEDIDADGTVDVRDALVVARGIKAGRTTAAWDVTRDGAVDQRDVDAIGTAAVRVNGGVR